MISKLSTIAGIATVGALLTGCATTDVYVPTDEPGISSPGLDAYDIRLIVANMMRQMRNEWQSEARTLGRLPVIAYTGIRPGRDMLIHVNTNEIVGFLSREILNSGLATFTTALHPDGKGGWSGLTYDVIDFANPDENPYLDPSSAPAPRGIQAPEYQLHGRIHGYRELRRGNLVEVNYTAELTLSNVRTGLMVWQGMHPIRKNLRR